MKRLGSRLVGAAIPEITAKAACNPHCTYTRFCRGATRYETSRCTNEECKVTTHTYSIGPCPQ
jgi:hypothetical protein